MQMTFSRFWHTHILHGRLNKMVCEDNTIGRYVYVWLEEFNKHLIFCEIEIYGFRKYDDQDLIWA